MTFQEFELVFDSYRYGRVPDRLRRELIDIWANDNAPEDNLPRHRWLRLFRRAGFVSDTGQPAPRSPLTIYRGCAAARVGALAWTSSLEIADTFVRVAHAFDESAFIYCAQIPPSGVLALIDGRGEHEVVIDPTLRTRAHRVASTLLHADPKTMTRRSFPSNEPRAC